MLINFHDPGMVVSAIHYLRSMRAANGVLREFEPVDLFGSAERLEVAVNASFLSHPLISASLAYTEPQRLIGLDRRRAHLKQFTRLAWGGLPEERVIVYGVAHDRDSHLLGSKLDPLSHKQLPIWSQTKKQIELFNTWRRMTNLQEGLTDPDDLWHRAFLLSIPQFLPAQFRREYRATDYKLTHIAAEGWIFDRDDLIDVFRVQGYQVASVTNHGIDVTNAAGVNFPYYGGKFSKTFDFSRLRDIRASAQERNPAAVGEELQELTNRFDRLQSERYDEFQKRFGAETFCPRHSVYPMFLSAYAATRPGGSSAAEILTQTQPETYGEFETSFITAICEKRSVCARAIVGAVGADFSRTERDFRTASDACLRIGAISEGNYRAAYELLRHAAEMFGSIVEHCEQGRGGRYRSSVQGALVGGRRDCERARAALGRALEPADMAAHLRDPASGMLPLSFGPTVHPTLNCEQ